MLANTTGEGAAKLAETLTGELRGFDFIQSGQHVEIDLAYGVACLANGMDAEGLFEEARAALDRFVSLGPAEGKS